MTRWSCVGAFTVAAIPMLYLLTAAADVPKVGEKRSEVQPAVLVGACNNEVRHAVHQSLYQPAQGSQAFAHSGWFVPSGMN